MLRGLSAFPFCSFDGPNHNHYELVGQGVHTYTLGSGLKLAHPAAMILVAPRDSVPSHFMPALIQDRRPAMFTIMCMSVSSSLHRAARLR